MFNPSLRIVSLLPSATEIVAALGLLDQLVGCSHECDYPEQVQQLPICTQPKFDPQGSSGDIHQRVTTLLETALSVYQVNLEILEQLQPTHIITQAQCEVCAVSLADVEAAVATLAHSVTPPRIISLQPNTLADVWQDIQRVGSLLGVGTATVLNELKSRVDHCAQITAEITRDLPIAARPTVACLEWTDPLMGAGNWVPELVELAGGRSCFGVIGQHSTWLSWADLLAADPGVIIFMPCGYDLAKTQAAALEVTQHPDWPKLQAVQKGRVFITDGNQYFNRPGPRLVDSLEILAEILHPDRCDFGYEGSGWESLKQG